MAEGNRPGAAAARAAATTLATAARSATASGTAVGLAFAVVQDGQVVLADGAGAARTEPVVAVTPATMFRVGSITKTFTAVAVLQLVEHGQVGLDDPLAAHLRSITVRPRRGGRPPTVRDALTHRSGLGEWQDWREPFRRGNPLAHPADQPAPTLARRYRRGLTGDVPPGERFAYSNHCFAALGQLVADVRGRPYAEVLRTDVLRPLGLPRADVELCPAVRSALAQGYVLAAGVAHPVDYEQVAIAPAGALHADLDEMARYLGWVLGGGPDAVLSRGTRDLMLTAQGPTDPRLPGMGLGFSLDRLHGHRVVGHDGGWPGFVSAMWGLPDHGFGVVVLSNSFDLTARALADQALAAYLAQPGTAGAGPPVAPPSPVRAPGTTLSPNTTLSPGPPAPPALAGSYAPPSGWNSNVRLWREHGYRVEVTTAGPSLTVRTARGPFATGVHLTRPDPTDSHFWVGAGVRKGAPVPVRLLFSSSRDGAVVGAHLTLGGPVWLTRVTARRPRPGELLGRALLAAETAAHLDRPAAIALARQGVTGAGHRAKRTLATMRHLVTRAGDHPGG